MKVKGINGQHSVSFSGIEYKSDSSGVIDVPESFKDLESHGLVRHVEEIKKDKTENDSKDDFKDNFKGDSKELKIEKREYKTRNKKGE